MKNFKLISAITVLVLCLLIITACKNPQNTGTPFTPADKDMLLVQIGLAEDLLDSTALSPDGYEITVDNFWLIPDDYAALVSAITDAQKVADKAKATQTEVDTAEYYLSVAIDAADTAKRTGLADTAKVLLGTRITEAKSNLALIIISADGSDVVPDMQWVKQADYDIFDTVIKAAEAVNTAIAVTPAGEIADVLRALNAAILVFNDSKEFGSRQLPKYTITFESAGGSLTPYTREIYEGFLIDPAPDTPNWNSKEKPEITTGGLYSDIGTFDGWYNGSEKWKFEDPVTGPITLTARWTTKIDSIPVDTNTTTISQTLAYVNANPNMAFTLALGANISMAGTTLAVHSGSDTFNPANANVKGALTIKGLGSTRIDLSLSSNGRMFVLSEGAMLTLDNIALKGRSSNSVGNLVFVYRAYYTMINSSITGNATADTGSDYKNIPVVVLEGYNGPSGQHSSSYFTMQDSEITNNTANSVTTANNWMGGGFHTHQKGMKIVLDNSTITGNKVRNADHDMRCAQAYAGYLTISKNTRVGVITLHYNESNDPDRGWIYVSGPEEFTGSITVTKIETGDLNFGDGIRAFAQGTEGHTLTQNEVNKFTLTGTGQTLRPVANNKVEYAGSWNQ